MSLKTRILFLDDEPGLNQELREDLENNGFITVTPKSIDEAFHEININGADLLIHCAHKTQTYWKMVDGIFAQYPEFPSLQFSSGPVGDEFIKKMKGPFHQKLRLLVPRKIFLKRVRKLIFMGRLNRQNMAMKKALVLQTKTESLIDRVEINHFKNGVAQFFADEFKAKNAYVLRPGDFGYFLAEMWKITPLKASDDELKDRRAVHAAVASTEETLSQEFGRLSTSLPSGWELRKSSTFIPSGRVSAQSYAFLPLLNVAKDKVIGHVFLVNPALYGDSSIQKALPHLMKVVGRHLENLSHVAEAKNLSYVDDLSDLYNQRYLKVVLDKEISRSQRSRQPFSILFMDIDHFKHVNDTRGHVVGSKMLIEVAKIIQQHTRAVDYSFRYGGDEFLMCLVGSNSENAFTVAERVRKQVEETKFDIDGVEMHITLSIGIATYPDHASTKEQILEMADRAMYHGKSVSRNVVYVAS